MNDELEEILNLEDEQEAVENELEQLLKEYEKYKQIDQYNSEKREIKKQFEEVIKQVKLLFAREYNELEIMFPYKSKKIEQLFIDSLELLEEKEDTAKAQREMLNLLMKALIKNLQINGKEHLEYDFDKLKELVRWNPLFKVVAALRVKELKNSKVLLRGGKYDLSAVKQTYYGKKILEACNLGNRYSLTKAEYESFFIKTKKLKLEIPEEIEPTKAEIYFEN